MISTKFNFLFINIKKIIIPFIFVLFTILLIVFSNSNFEAAKKGINLWLNSVLPSLLPFFIATELLSYTNIIYYLGKLLNNIMRPLFNVPGEGAFAFIMGIISGYPTGVKIVANMKKDNICTKEECERLIAFTNNSGPLFIIGTVGTSLLYDTSIGFLLLFTHILACITVGIIFRFWKYNKNDSYKRYINIQKNRVTFNNLGDIIGESIKSATNTVVMIGGFVILFSVINSMLNNSNFYHIIINFTSPFFNLIGIDNNFLQGIYTGFIELTNGVQYICNIPTKTISITIIICAFLLGFGGISVMLQVLSITSKSNISIKPYIIGKILHGIIAAFYTYLILSNFSYFNLNI